MSQGPRQQDRPTEIRHGLSQQQPLEDLDSLIPFRRVSRTFTCAFLKSILVLILIASNCVCIYIYILYILYISIKRDTAELAIPLALGAALQYVALARLKPRITQKKPTSIINEWKPNQQSAQRCK